MGYFKYLASIPVVLSVLAASYGAINYTSKLTNQIDASTTTIATPASATATINVDFGSEGLNFTTNPHATLTNVTSVLFVYG